MMATMSIPEELDVFTVPHSRMKQLVSNYYSRVEDTNFSSPHSLQSLIDCLRAIFTEFKCHEQIENKLIVRRLTDKMRQRADYNPVICDCHKDNRLSEMMSLFADGLKTCTTEDRINYGIKLLRELHTFTDSFLPHMKEEEEVFQPLLMQYFTYDELRLLKQKVIEHHSLNYAQLHPAQTEAQQTTKAVLFQTPKATVATHTANSVSPVLSRTAKNGVVTLDELSIAEIYVPEIKSNVKAAVPELKVRVKVAGDEMSGMICSESHVVNSKTSFAGETFDNRCSAGEKEAKCKGTALVKSACVRMTDAICLAASVDRIPSSLVNPGWNVKNRLEELNFIVSRTEIEEKKLDIVDIPEKVSDEADLEPAAVSDRARDCFSLASLPSELVLRVFGLLSVRDLGHCAQVCTAWSDLAYDRSLWTACLPVQWAEGNWGFEKVDLDLEECEMERRCSDARGLDDPDADLDSRVVDVLDSIVEHVLPKIGHGIKKLILSNSGALTDDVVAAFLLLCPNITHLDLSLTSITDAALCSLNDEVKEERKSSGGPGGPGGCLEHLDLSSCHLITDIGLNFVSGVTSRLRHANLSGCVRVTSAGLWQLALASPTLDPAQLFYCDNIDDGPFPDLANGCCNLGCRHGRVVCCRAGQ